MFVVLLQLLGFGDMVDSGWNRSYILSTQSDITGGFSKWPDCHPGEREREWEIVVCSFLKALISLCTLFKHSLSITVFNMYQVESMFDAYLSTVVDCICFAC